MYISSKQSFYEDYETMSFIQTVLQYLSIKQQITLPDTGEPGIFRIHNTEARKKTKIKHQETRNKLHKVAVSVELVTSYCLFSLRQLFSTGVI